MIPIVACIKVGTRYGPEYVNRLAAMVERNTTVPYEFVCLTDDNRGVLFQGFHVEPISTDLPGWWSKLVLFKPHPYLAGRRVLFLDLDTVIVGNMDFLLEYDGGFAILSDFYRPQTFGSAVMAIPPGFGPHIWWNFDPDNIDCAGDQDWIWSNLNNATRWQDLYPGKIVSYKVHCQDGLPADARVVCYHGTPRPHETTNIHWVQEHWHDHTPVTR